VSERSACAGVPGTFAPVIDRNRCEARTDCVRVCPYDVFEIGRLSQQDKASMSLLGRLKSAAHKNRQAFVVNPDACDACNLCIDACPEKAITLRPFRLMH
jgi:NAD-dependent dihydropyrimidine dehydrogenase PreA subunit